MFIHIKRLFQLSGVTLFTTLFFLGAMGVNSAQADHDNFSGKTVIKETCHNGTDKPTKRKIKSDFRIRINPANANLQGTNACGAGCVSPYPAWAFVSIRIDDFDGVAVSETFSEGDNDSPTADDAGVALTKNFKKGKFQTFLKNGTADRVLSLTGTLVVDKKTGDAQKIVGKINGYDTTRNCTYVGKFKGKR